MSGLNHMLNYDDALSLAIELRVGNIEEILNEEQIEHFNIILKLFGLNILSDIQLTKTTTDIAMFISCNDLSGLSSNEMCTLFLFYSGEYSKCSDCGDIHLKNDYHLCSECSSSKFGDYRIYNIYNYIS